VVDVVELAAVELGLLRLVSQTLNKLKRIGTLQGNVQQRVRSGVTQGRDDGTALRALEGKRLVDAYSPLARKG
jgi:hypothetical protein